MNITKSQRKRLARKRFKKSPGPFTPVDLTRDPETPKWMSRAFINNRYVVMIDDYAVTSHGVGIRAMIQKHDDTAISWKEKQNVKNAIFGKEVTAIEYYPPEDDLVDTCNIYWLWIFKDGVIPVPEKV